MNFSGSTYSESDRSALATMTMRLFSHCQLGSQDSLDLLGLSPRNRNALVRYRQGRPFRANRDLLERVAHLLAIHAALRLLFPSDTTHTYSWMTTANRAFGGATPVAVVKQRGMIGLIRVGV